MPRHAWTTLISVVLASQALAAEENRPQTRTGPAGAEDPQACNAVPLAGFLDKEHAPTGEGWIRLFDGRTLEGWKALHEDRKHTWKVVDGVLEADFPEGQHGTNIYTDRKFEDFEIYYEYLVPPNGNSGVFLRGQYEIQIQDDHGVPVDKPKDWGNGGMYGQKAPSRNVSKPQGQWQSVYATIQGRKINVWLNGQRIIEDYEPPKATHIYRESGVKDGDPTGPIILQGDHKPIKFRHVMLRPLPRPQADRRTPAAPATQGM